MSIVRRTWPGIGMILASVFLVVATAIAEHAVGPQETTHPQGGELNKRIVDFSVQAFSLARTYLDDTYRTRLPRALAAANGSLVSESDIAMITAELFGRIGDSQLASLVTQALALKKTVDEKTEAQRTPADLDLSTFLDRLLSAAKVIRSGQPGFEALASFTPSGPKFDAFRSAFVTAHLAVQRANREGFYTLLDEAKNGATKEKRDAASNALRTRFASVLPFLKGQAEAKNADLLKRFTEAVSFDNGSDGAVLDLLDALKAPHRVVLGRDPEQFARKLSDALSEYAALRDKLAEFQLALQKHGDVQGNVFRPREAAPRPEAPPAKESPDQKMAEWFVAKKCTSCHDQDAEGKMKLFDAKGNLLDPTRIPRMLEVFQERNIHGAMLKKIREAKASMTEPEKALLRDWAAAHGVPGFDMNGKDFASPVAPPAPQQPAPPAAGPETVTDALKQGYFKGYQDPAKLAETLKAKGAHAPILNIGIVEDILDSKHIGALTKAEGVRALEAFEATLPSKSDEVIVYCGCCQLDTCPNVLSALRVLRERGYTNVRVLELPESLEEDWTSKGYPLAPGQGGSGG